MVDDDTWADIEEAALAVRVGLISYAFYRIGDYRDAEDI